jgi:hypothetical protein
MPNRQVVPNRHVGADHHGQADTEAELIAMARAELKVHADCPDGIAIAVLRSEDSWEFRTEADERPKPSPAIPNASR